MRLADEPYAIARDQLIPTLPEFGHLREARIAWVFAPSPVMLRGQPCAGFIGEPRVQSPFRHLFEALLDDFVRPVFAGDPVDFLVMIDIDYWATVSALLRERLVYHELSHVVQAEDKYGAPVFDEEGRPKLRTVRHDTEVFDREVARYGPKTIGLQTHLAAIQAGRKAERGRTRRRR